MKSKTCLILVFVALVASLVLLAVPKEAKEAEAYQIRGLNASTTNVLPINVSTQHPPIKALLIREFGTSSPLIKVAACESQFRQFNEDGDVLHGIVNPKDIGIFQINEKYWLDKSIELGYDIYTIEGNINMAKYIYQVQPTAWYLSEFCWSPVDNSNSSSTEMI